MSSPRPLMMSRPSRMVSASRMLAFCHVSMSSCVALRSMRLISWSSLVPFAFIWARTSSPERLTTPTSCPWSASSTTTSPTCTSILEGLRKNPLRFALNRTSTTSNGRWPDGKATPSNQSNTVSDPQPLTPQFPLLRHPRGLPSAPFLQLLQLIEAKIRRFRLPFSAKYSTER